MYKRPIPEYTLDQPVLTIKDLNLFYGEQQILRDINLQVLNISRPGIHQGQCIALLGPSGCGKTQLFRCIAGMQRPTSGEVLVIDNKPVTPGTIGVVQQSYPLMQHRTIVSNLKMVCKDFDKIMNLLVRFGLEKHMSSYPSQLSGGQRQRIAIIQQMLGSKHYLLMDEPFSGLDVIAKDHVCDLINEVNLVDELNTTIFTTHDLEAAVQIADTIWVMGREEGKPGATIVKTFDLIKRGLAWDSDIVHNSEYWPMVHELKELFKTL